MTLDDLLEFINNEDLRLRKRFQRDLSEKEWVLAHVVKLQEEVGELSEQVLIAQSLQRDSKLKLNEKELASEIADVIITTMLIAKDHEVNVKKALEDKIKVIEARYKD